MWIQRWKIHNRHLHSEAATAESNRGTSATLHHLMTSPKHWYNWQENTLEKSWGYRLPTKTTCNDETLPWLGKCLLEATQATALKSSMKSNKILCWHQQFPLYLSAVLDTTAIDLTKGVYIRARMDGQLFKLAYLWATTKTSVTCIQGLLYADDLALVANYPKHMQKTGDDFSSAGILSSLKMY